MNNNNNNNNTNTSPQEAYDLYEASLEAFDLASQAKREAYSAVNQAAKAAGVTLGTFQLTEMEAAKALELAELAENEAFDLAIQAAKAAMVTFGFHCSGGTFHLTEWGAEKKEWEAHEEEEKTQKAYEEKYLRDINDAEEALNAKAVN